MRLLAFLLLIITGCRPVKIDAFYLMENQESHELHNVIHKYRFETGDWPTEKYMDSLKRTNDYLKRFSIIKLNVLGDSTLKSLKAFYSRDSTINIFSKLEYPDFEDPIQSFQVKEIFVYRDSGSYLATWSTTDLVIQKDIQLRSRLELNSKEKKKFRQWEKMRKANRQLLLQDLKTKETRNLKVGTRLFLFDHKDSSVSHESIYDNATQMNYDYPNEWVLSTINTSDSTINIDIWGGGHWRKRIKFNDIDSLNIKSQKGNRKV